jgi:hypothetical protein
METLDITANPGLTGPLPASWAASMRKLVKATFK